MTTHNSSHVWTTQELQTLRDQYPHVDTHLLADRLRLDKGTVYRKAAALRLKKSPAFLASDASGRIQRGRTDPRMVKTQFKPGMTPWNKGKSGVSGHHPNTVATQFQPGRAAHEASNYLPIGSLRKTRDGYWERKVTDDPSLVPARRWVAEHRLVWERDMGPIPEGCLVVFKTIALRNSTTPEHITVDMLECITRAENGRRNCPTNLHPEIARLIQLKGAITRQSNRIQREAKESAQ